MQQVSLSTAVSVSKTVLDALGASAQHAFNQRHRDVNLGAQAAIQLLLAALCRSAGVDYRPVLAQMSFLPEVEAKNGEQLEATLLGLRLTDATVLPVPEATQRSALEELLRLLTPIQRDALEGPDTAETVERLGGAQVVEGIKIGTTNVISLLAIALAEPLGRTIPDTLAEVGLGDMPAPTIHGGIKLLAGYKERVRADV